MGDLYALLWPNGVSHPFLIEAWTKRLGVFDTEGPVVPVDGPEGEPLMRAALAAHRENFRMTDMTRSLPFRDSTLPGSAVRPYVDWSPLTHAAAIGRSKVAIYHLGGWFDRYVKDQLILFRDLPNP
jgi:hypothetical protein